jgi:hypothetical protein
MLVNTPNKTPSKWVIKVLDAVSAHLLPYNWRVPLLYTQSIQVTPDMYPPKPPDRSQLYKSLHSPVEMPWVGGVPLGRVKSDLESQNVRLIVKQFRHKVHTDNYNPPLHLKFPWDKYGGQEGALQAALAAQRDFTEQHKAWLNQFRVAYDELRDEFFLEVSLHHFFPQASFRCDLEDVPVIFASEWHIVHRSFTDFFKNKKHRYHIMSLGEPIVEITERLKGRAMKYKDNNVLNSRRYNLVK